MCYPTTPISVTSHGFSQPMLSQGRISVAASGSRNTDYRRPSMTYPQSQRNVGSSSSARTVRRAYARVQLDTVSYKQRAFSMVSLSSQLLVLREKPVQLISFRFDESNDRDEIQERAVPASRATISWPRNASSCQNSRLKSKYVTVNCKIDVTRYYGGVGSTSEIVQLLFEFREATKVILTPFITVFR